MKEVNIISKVVGRSGAEASPSSAILPNMSGYATKTELNTLRDEFKDFLEGADADVIINKWQDLVSFLEGISEEFDLLSMLGLKADKSELSNYVTIATEQTISAHKDFLNGLSIGGLGITKSQDDVIYFDANLVVRGGITMFGTNSVDVPTIMDAIAVDGKTISKDNGYLEVIGGTGGGLTEVHWDDVIGRPTLLSSFIDDVVQGHYLPLSGNSAINGVLNIRLVDTDYGLMYVGARDMGFVTGIDNYAPNGGRGAGFFCEYINGSEVGRIGIQSDSTPYYMNPQGSYVLLHSGNWRNYVTLSGNPIYEGILTVNGSDARGSYPAIRLHIPNVNWQQFLMRGDGIVELRYGDGGQSGRWGQLALGTIFLDDQRGDVLYFPGKEYFDNHGNIHIPNADGSWSWNIFNSNGSIVMTIYTNGNILSAGGITMYSDIRKKTKLQEVELTLQQIADAPLIEHYYNSDEKRTTHVGTIAQYWASMNDWFCKLDNDGYYTMEIQNAALASAISIARELVKYESKTDRKIRLLKHRVNELEEKIEKFENKGA